MDNDIAGLALAASIIFLLLSYVILYVIIHAAVSRALREHRAKQGPVEFDPPLTDAESAAYWAAINDDPEPTN